MNILICIFRVSVLLLIILIVTELRLIRENVVVYKFIL